MSVKFAMKISLSHFIYVPSKSKNHTNLRIMQIL